MRLRTTWNDKLRFTAEADGHRVDMDTKAPLGSDTALTPKQLVVAGICGCTGMDVVALLRKFKQPVESFAVDADVTTTDSGQPQVFKTVKLTYQVKGDVDPGKVIEAVTLSQTKYCGVSAMLSKAVPISYVIELNGREIGAGEAKF